MNPQDYIIIADLLPMDLMKWLLGILLIPYSVLFIKMYGMLCELITMHKNPAKTGFGTEQTETALEGLCQTQSELLVWLKTHAEKEELELKLLRANIAETIRIIIAKAIEDLEVDLKEAVRTAISNKDKE